MTTAATVWQNCYDENWNRVLVPSAFSHPAKMARGLCRRIFEHLEGEYGLPAGSTVVDCFGGVGTTGIIGASRGHRVLMCELEPKFVELARQNFELHRNNWEIAGEPLPVIVQGDSRQLRTVLGPALAECVCSSPPFLDARSETTSSIKGSTPTKHDPEAWGATPGQLGAMPSGNVEMIVSSPPYQTGGHHDHQMDAWNANGRGQYAHGERGYADESEAQLGGHGETFWAASVKILRECFLILKPNGLAAFVVKSFVKKGRVVDFPAQWRTAAESVGFKTLEEVHASLVKEDTSPSLFGGQSVRRTERKSFFRRLCEKKGSPKIDYEVVLIMRKRAGDS